jgi:branched-chain amino acid transport system permease protein
MNLWTSKPSRVAAFVVVIGLLAVYPSQTTSEFQLRVFTLMFTNAALAVGLVIPLGLTRLYNFSQGTMFGVGAYTAAVLTARYEVPFEIAILASVGASTVGGLVLGVTARRVRGDQWALVSMAFTIAVFQVFSNWPLLGGREGFSGIDEQRIFGIWLDNSSRFYLLALTVLVVSFVIAQRTKNSYVGRAMLAVGHDEVAAGALGIDVGFHKSLALALSSAIAGLAGAVTVATVLFVSPNSYDLVSSFAIVIWVIVGGVSSVPGAALVACLLTYATERSRGIADYRIALLGALLIFVLFLRSGVFTSWIRTARKTVARR